MTKAVNESIKLDSGTIQVKKRNQILSLILISIAFVNIYLPDLWGDRFEELEDEMFAYHNPYYSLVRLLASAVIVVLPIALSFERRTFTRFSVYFGIPSFVLNLLFFDEYMYGYQHPDKCQFTEFSRPFVTNFYFRACFFAIFELYKLVLILLVAKRNKEDLKFTSINDFLKFLLLSIPLLFVNMPITFPSQFTGSFLSEIVISSLNIVNIIWILVIVLLIVIFTKIFRKKTAEDKHILLLVLSLSLLFQYNLFSQTLEFTLVVRFPLQLCNLACFILPIAILSNKRPLLCFASIANVLGAIAAVFVCDTPGGEGLLYALNVHYIIEHTGIIVIGVLLLTLNIITPLKKEDLKSVVTIYNIYFIVVLILGTIFNAIHAANGFEPIVYSIDPYVTMDFHCNYLFMFLEDVVVKIAPSLAVLYRTYIPIGQHAKLLLSELVMYFVFLLVCTIPFYVVCFIQKRPKKVQDKE